MTVPATGPAIAVVVPAYRVTGQILAVIEAIGPEVSWIIVVDDGCPDRSGQYVVDHCRDGRVRVLFNERNLGVGGAVMRGYREAIACGAEILVKIDGDGQMDPRLLPRFVAPIADGRADYTKGNRFYDIHRLTGMPRARLIGNAVLSFLAKLSTGYWDIFDPTNGYTAIHARVVERLPLERISERYFFETDLLFRLGAVRAVVWDVPMDAVYAGERSNLRIRSVAGEFGRKHLANLGKRIFYTYYLRDFSIGSVELPAGVLLLAFGTVFGLRHWMLSAATGHPAAAGTVMLAALPVILGIQLLLAFLAYDIAAVPRRPLHPSLVRPGESAPAAGAVTGA